MLTGVRVKCSVFLDKNMLLSIGVLLVVAGFLVAKTLGELFSPEGDLEHSSAKKEAKASKINTQVIEIPIEVPIKQKPIIKQAQPVQAAIKAETKETEQLNIKKEKPDDNIKVIGKLINNNIKKSSLGQRCRNLVSGFVGKPLISKIRDILIIRNIGNSPTQDLKYKIKDFNNESIFDFNTGSAGHRTHRAFTAIPSVGWYS